MKRFLLILLVLVMLPSYGALGEDVLMDQMPDAGASSNAQGEFVIGATTTLSGTFFTNMWGNNTSDIDIRSLINGYSPVVWTMQSRFELNPLVASSVSVAELSNGGKRFMVALHRDLCYNDGTPITARDYVFSMMLFADPVINKLGAISTNSGYITGYEEYLSGQSGTFAGLHLVDDYTYTVDVLPEFLPFFFEISMIDAIPYPLCVICPGTEVRDDGQGTYIANIDSTVTERIWSVETLQKTICDPDTGYLSHPYVTCGPYKLMSFDWDTRIAKFELNPYYKGYYDGTKPTIDDLVFKNVLPEDMIARFESGEIQLLNKVVYSENIQDGMSLAAFGSAQSATYPRMGSGFLSFSCEQGPMQFEAVRKAIAYSFDRHEYNMQFVGNFGWDVQGYYGIGQWMVQMILGNLAPQGEAQADMSGWELLLLKGLSELEVYSTNLDLAKQLLIADGWTLNENGQDFQEGTDKVRYKKLSDGTLMGLNLRYAQMKDSVAAQLLLDTLTTPLETLGISIETTVLPIEDLFFQYYRQEERVFDMMYIATNFISIFDPYFVVNTDDQYQGTQNTTGIRDAQLEQLAFDLRSTESGALLEYCQKWLRFQKRFNETLPMLPLYSNVYFDFFINDLKNYAPQAEMNWPIAILYARLGDEVPAYEVLQTSPPANEPSANDDLLLEFTIVE